MIEKIGDKIPQIIENLQAKKQNNTMTLEKFMKFNLVCDVCGKEFEKEIETNDKYYTPPTAICSDECQAKVNEEYFQKRILILPKRFRTIESDQRKLVEQGIKESRNHGIKGRNP